MLILISGVPGTGKTSVAEVLAKKLKAKELDIKRIAHKNRLILGYDDKSKSLIIDEKKISRAVEKELKNKTGIFIIASHLSHFIKPELAKLMIVLRCNPDILERRLKRRGYSGDKLGENIMCEYIDTILIEALQEGHKKHLHEIDTSRKTPSATADEIIAVLNKKKKMSFGNIKWLG
jgi:adenylate kinase